MRRAFSYGNVFGVKGHYREVVTPGAFANSPATVVAVGYESLQHFSREYKRLFGEPPRRDIMRRRGGE